MKLVRFDHAAHRLGAGERAARVAADTGYADQSQLPRDVVAFTGAPPPAVAGEPFLAVDDLAAARSTSNAAGSCRRPRQARRTRPGSRRRRCAPRLRARGPG
ncbi:hypothetical protein [Streptomyces cyanogenus]|uniref:hypothetical protein n=1 Tax=Streptomyces cyanogenus TaxID=80860 RepID=UPI003C79F5A1